jgi:hypothetical protein
MRKGFSANFLTAGLLLFVGAGCLESDMELLAGFVSRWLEQRGVIDKNGNPSTGAVKFAASGGWVSSGDKDNDAIITAGQAAKGINAADQAINLAGYDVAAGKFDDANAKLDAQLGKRPDDHRLRNAKGATLLRQGRVDASKDYFASTSSCDTRAGKVGGADLERCKRMLRDENDQLKEHEPPDLPDTPRDAGSKTCVMVNQRKGTLLRLEDIALQQNDHDAAERHRIAYGNLDNTWPTCRK